MKIQRINSLLLSVLLYTAVTSCLSINSLEQQNVSYVVEEEFANPFNIEALIYNKDGIGYLNSENESLKILIPGNLIVWDKLSSSNKDKIIISYSNNDVDSTYISLIDTKTFEVQKLHSVQRSYYYSIAWSPNDDEVAVGYHNEIERNGIIVAGDGSIEIISINGNIRSLGCNISKQVHFWLPNGNLVVSQGRGYKNLYVVDSDNCNTLKNISVDEKESISFSPDGKYMSYIKRREVYFRREQRMRKVPDLFIANYDGTDSKIVVSYQYDPRNISWSPDSRRLIFDVSSQEWSNIRHISIYSIIDDNATLSRREDSFYGLPSSTKPMWSPVGNHILFSNIYNDRANSHGIVYHSVVRNINNNEHSVVDNDVLRPHERNRNRGFGQPIFWVDNNTVLVGSFDNYSIIDIKSDDRLTYPYESMGGFIRDFIYIGRNNQNEEELE